jgi:hypothetical protein
MGPPGELYEVGGAKPLPYPIGCGGWLPASSVTLFAPKGYDIAVVAVTVGMLVEDIAAEERCLGRVR